MKSCRRPRHSAVRLKKRCQFSKLRSGRSMSALGDKRTFCVTRVMSRYLPKADIRSHEWHVRSGGDGNKLIIALTVVEQV